MSNTSRHFKIKSGMIKLLEMRQNWIKMRFNVFISCLAVTASSWNSWLRLWPHMENVFVSLTVLILSHTDDIINEPDQCIETQQELYAER